MVGKRVDYSGRAVIVVQPDLNIDECMVPKEMALEILKPAIIGYLLKYGFAMSINHAKKLIERRTDEVWDILNELVETRYPLVLLNRAPTLHRLSILAFKVKLWNKNAIGISSLVCPGFNADFDGDQMALHYLLSAESLAEGFMLMSPNRNLGSTTHGGLTVGAFKDIALGIYTLTVMNDKKHDRLFASYAEVEHALNEKIIKLNDNIKVLCSVNSSSSDKKITETTAGRLKLWNVIP
jgi:DNA-directed RNA polymerase subunit beta'